MAAEEQCTDIIEVAEGPSICAKPEERPEHHAAAVLEEAAYAYKAWVQAPYNQVLDTMKSQLVESGFMLVNQVDVSNLLKNTTGDCFPDYSIIGVVNQDWMRKALELDRDLGLLLPLNLVVYEQSGGSVIAAIDTMTLTAIADGRDLQSLARVAKERLQDVIDHVAAGVG